MNGTRITCLGAAAVGMMAVVAAAGAGADVLVAGSAVFRHPSGVREAIRLLREAAESAVTE